MAPSESSPLLNNISSPSQFFASKLFRNFKNTRKWAVGSLIKVGMGTVSTISSPSSSLRSSNIDWNYSNGMSTNTDPFSIVVRTYASLYGRRSYSSSNNTKESVNNEEKKIETKHETNAVIKKQTESDFLLTSIHDIDKYIQSHKNELTKEEAVHEFFKMMKFCLAYCQLHNGRVSKKLISLIYSVAKGVLKAVQNNSQFLRDIYNLLCMLEFKNYPALHMPCIQLAFGFRETKDIEMCASLFENHILPILQSVYESKSDFYSDYLLAAFILLPEFAVIREDFVEKIFECTSKFVPNDCYSLPNAVIIERNYSVQLLPTTNQSGLIQVLKYFSKYFFEYISSVETKSKKNGSFDGNILVASFKNIRRFGMQIEIQKYNYALEVLVRNNSPQATEFFEEILKLGYTKPDETTYGTLVKHLSNNVKKGKEGHDLVMKCYNDMMESGRVNQKALTTFLTVTRYHSTRFQELREKITNQLYDWKEPLDQFSTTEAILHTIQKHGIEVAYEKLGDLRREGKAEMSPSVYNAILHAVSSDIQQVTIAFNVLNYMIEDKINPNDHILVSLLSIETKLHNLLYKPGKVDPVIVDRLERYKATIDSLLKDLIEDVCEGKAHNYVLISAAMKRFKDTQEYDKVIKIFENIRDRMTMEAKQDGSIYLIVMKSCESKKNVQALYECLEHLLRQELPVIPWQLYRHIISLISRIDFGTAEQKDHLVEQIYTKYAPLFADVDQLKRQVDPKCLAKTAWKIPPGKGLTSAEVAFIENAKQVIARKSQESSSVTIDEQTQ